MCFVHARVGRLCKDYIVENAGRRDCFFDLVEFGIGGFLGNPALISLSGASTPLYGCIL